MTNETTDAESFSDLELEAENSIYGIKVKLVNSKDHEKSEYKTAFKIASDYVEALEPVDRNRIKGVKLFDTGSVHLKVNAQSSMDNLNRMASEFRANTPERLQVRKLRRKSLGCSLNYDMMSIVDLEKADESRGEKQ